MVLIMYIHKKATLWETTVNSMKQERLVWVEINFVLGKNGSHKPYDNKLDKMTPIEIILWLKMRV